MKRTLFIIFSFIFIIGNTTCVSAEIKYTIIPENPRPGEPVTIAVSGSAKEALLFINEKQSTKSAFFAIPVDSQMPWFMAAILTIPSTAATGEAIIRINNESGMILEIPLIINSREFISEIIELNPVNTGIRTDASPQRTQESNRLWAILTTTGNHVYHTDKFVLPVTSTRRTSFFGDRRVYKYANGNTDTSVHAGVDFGVPTGTEVFACGDGKVVLAVMRIVTGNSIIIEHLPGVYSLYYHLNTINVKEGDIVSAGSVIGLSGSTGLSTGPHLHWELRVSSENTDPDVFVARPLIDKDLIISRIYE